MIWFHLTHCHPKLRDNYKIIVAADAIESIREVGPSMGYEPGTLVRIKSGVEHFVTETASKISEFAAEASRKAGGQ